MRFCQEREEISLMQWLSQGMIIDWQSPLKNGIVVEITVDDLENVLSVLG